MKQAYNFQLSQPSGRLAALVQGIWSVSVAQPDPLMKLLYSDAGSGIVFNLIGEMVIGDETLSEGVIMLPTNKQAENIVLTAGAQLAGIRFHPAIGFGVLGKHYDKPTLLLPEHDQPYHLYRLYERLRVQRGNERHIETLHLWADENLDFTHVIPNSLKKALACIDQDKAPAQLSANTELSQRQIERIFKRWLGMTPKHYQRILRIKKTICFLRSNGKANLADVAQQFGFSDQAHMTREFQAIACITPGNVGEA